MFASHSGGGASRPKAFVEIAVIEDQATDKPAGKGADKPAETASIPAV